MRDTFRGLLQFPGGETASCIVEVASSFSVWYHSFAQQGGGEKGVLCCPLSLSFIGRVYGILPEDHNRHSLKWYSFWWNLRGL